MSFYGELKQRSVPKVAVLYVIAAWLLLLVTDVLSSLLTVPEWTDPLLAISLTETTEDAATGRINR